MEAGKGSEQPTFRQKLAELESRRTDELQTVEDRYKHDRIALMVTMEPVDQTAHNMLDGIRAYDPHKVAQITQEVQARVSTP
jgi:hypothetical protein